MRQKNVVFDTPAAVFTFKFKTLVLVKTSVFKKKKIVINFSSMKAQIFQNIIRSYYSNKVSVA